MSRPSLGTRTIVCLQCNKSYTYNRSNRNGSSATKCNSCKVSNRRRLVKAMAVDYKGGSCILCGYNKCIVALDFHHINPDDKVFGIAYKGYTKSWKEIKLELDKCVLVCANCHREIEAGITKIPM